MLAQCEIKRHGPDTSGFRRPAERSARTAAEPRSAKVVGALVRVAEWQTR
jgi:hypothetical protein